MRMPRIGAFALLLFGLTLLGGLRAAEDEQAPAREESFVGKVESTRDAQQNITAVKLTLDTQDTLDIKLDEKGKDLGEQMDRKRAEVTGTLAEEAGKKVLTVLQYREALPATAQLPDMPEK
ncbi:MAG: hypothetical protein M5U26_05020 [Planctomycetota bacterium]|nr:hypothetical protein [Planctomycetota bacterium]